MADSKELWQRGSAFFVALGAVYFIKSAMLPDVASPTEDGIWQIEVFVVLLVGAAFILQEGMEGIGSILGKTERASKHRIPPLMLIVTLAASLAIWIAAVFCLKLLTEGSYVG